MMKNFVPEDFQVPLSVAGPEFVLVKLTPELLEIDFDAVISSKDSLKHLFGPEDPWPPDDLTLEDNLGDLQRHQQEFDNREAFAYSVLSDDREYCLGCVYLYPSERADHDVQIYYWVRDSQLKTGLEGVLGHFLQDWLCSAWPFERPFYPGRSFDRNSD